MHWVESKQKWWAEVEEEEHLGPKPGGGIPKGGVKAGGWRAPTTGGVLADAVGPRKKEKGNETTYLATLSPAQWVETKKIP